MTREEFNAVMRLLNDIFGPVCTQQAQDTWYQILQKYPAQSARDAAWRLGETFKGKLRLADIIESMGGGGVVGGGSQHVESTGCFCGGSGWVNVEKQPREMVMMRCICDRGDRLNAKYARLTDEMIRMRRVSINGEIHLKNPDDEAREAKILGMDTEKLIAGCKYRLGQIGGRF